MVRERESANCFKKKKHNISRDQSTNEQILPNEVALAQIRMNIVAT